MSSGFWGPDGRDAQVAYTELDRLRKQNAVLTRELERHRHGVTIEGDFVCPDSLQLDRLRAENDRLWRIRSKREDRIAELEAEVDQLQKNCVGLKIAYDRAFADAVRLENKLALAGKP